MKMKPLLGFPLVVACLVFGPETALAGVNIGTAAGVTNQVTGKLGDDSRSLKLGDRVFQDETIETTEESNAQLLFLDETVLTVGPESSVLLDTFIFDPEQNTGEIVLNTTKGVFRFITGSIKDPAAYKIGTPVATLSLRGTIIEWRHLGNDNLLVILREGGAEVCLSPSNCTVLDQPGTYIITDGSNFSGGKLEGEDVILDDSLSELYLLFLGGPPAAPGAFPPGPPPPPPPPGGGPPPPGPPPVVGFPPLLTGSSTIPAGLSSGPLPPGLQNNRTSSTFLPPGLQKKQGSP
jgi:hypothetical protein